MEDDARGCSFLAVRALASPVLLAFDRRAIVPPVRGAPCAHLHGGLKHGAWPRVSEHTSKDREVSRSAYATSTRDAARDLWTSLHLPPTIALSTSPLSLRQGYPPSSCWISNVIALTCIPAWHSRSLVLDRLPHCSIASTETPGHGVNATATSHQLWLPPALRRLNGQSSLRRWWTCIYPLLGYMYSIISRACHHAVRGARPCGTHILHTKARQHV